MSRTRTVVMAVGLVLPLALWGWFALSATPPEVIVRHTTEDASREIVRKLQRGDNVEIRPFIPEGVSKSELSGTQRAVLKVGPRKIVSYGPLTGKRQKKDVEQIESAIASLVSQFNKTWRDGPPQTSKAFAAYLEELATIEIFRAQLDLSRNGEAFLANCLAPPPKGFLWPGKGTKPIWINPETHETIVDRGKFLREAKTDVVDYLKVSEVFIVYPIDLSKYSSIRNYMEDSKKHINISVMSSVYSFNSHNFDARKKVYERTQELLKEIAAIKSNRLTVDGKKVANLREEDVPRMRELRAALAKEGVPRGLTAGPPNFYARPLRKYESVSWKR